MLPRVIFLTIAFLCSFVSQGASPLFQVHSQGIETSLKWISSEAKTLPCKPEKVANKWAISVQCLRETSGIYLPYEEGLGKKVLSFKVFKTRDHIENEFPFAYSSALDIDPLEIHLQSSAFTPVNQWFDWTFEMPSLKFGVNGASLLWKSEDLFHKYWLKRKNVQEIIPQLPGERERIKLWELPYQRFTDSRGLYLHSIEWQSIPELKEEQLISIMLGRYPGLMDRPAGLAIILTLLAGMSLGFVIRAAYSIPVKILLSIVLPLSFSMAFLLKYLFNHYVELGENVVYVNKQRLVRNSLTFDQLLKDIDKKQIQSYRETARKFIETLDKEPKSTLEGVPLSAFRMEQSRKEIEKAKDESDELKLLELLHEISEDYLNFWRSKQGIREEMRSHLEELGKSPESSLPPASSKVLSLSYALEGRLNLSQQLTSDLERSHKESFIQFWATNGSAYYSTKGAGLGMSGEKLLMILLAKFALKQQSLTPESQVAEVKRSQLAMNDIRNQLLDMGVSTQMIDRFLNQPLVTHSFSTDRSSRDARRYVWKIDSTEDYGNWFCVGILSQQSQLKFLANSLREGTSSRVYLRGEGDFESYPLRLQSHSGFNLAALLSKESNMPRFFFHRSKNDNLFLYYAKPVPGMNRYTSVFEVNLDDQFRQLQKTKNNLIAFFVLIVGLLFWLAWWISRMVTGPLQELARALQLRAKGEDYSMQVRGKDEFFRLSELFNLKSEDREGDHK